jgi:hypothetical protein
MTMIELPLAIRAQKTIQKMETKEVGGPYAYGIKEEVHPKITETVLGTRRSISVSVDGIRGVAVRYVRRVGAQFVTHLDQYSDSPVEYDTAHEIRSHILLPDGKWYEIDMDYHALLVLIASHTTLDRTAMPPPVITP